LAIDFLSGSLEAEFEFQRDGFRIGLRGLFLVQPALQDKPRRSRGILGPSLAENRQKTGKHQNTELPMNR
jgi:hypothetical protein